MADAVVERSFWQLGTCSGGSCVVERLFWQLGTCVNSRCRCREVILAVGDMQWWPLPL